MNNEWWRYENLDPITPGQGWHENAAQGDHPDDHIDFHVDLGCGNIPKARLGIDRSGKADIKMDLDNGTIYEAREEFSSNDVWEYQLTQSSATPPSNEQQNLLNKLLSGKFYKSKHGILPFPDNSIESVITHHFLEHVGDGFIDLIDDVYRVLVPGGKFRIIVPMYPSYSAYEDQDHKRLLGPESFLGFTGREGQTHWHESFATPYTNSRFELTSLDYTPADVLGLRVFNNQVEFTLNGDSVGPFISTDQLIPKSREMRLTLQK